MLTPESRRNEHACLHLQGITRKKTREHQSHFLTTTRAPLYSRYRSRQFLHCHSLRGATLIHNRISETLNHQPHPFSNLASLSTKFCDDVSNGSGVIVLTDSRPQTGTAENNITLASRVTKRRRLCTTERRREVWRCHKGRLEPTNLDDTLQVRIYYRIRNYETEA